MIFVKIPSSFRFASKQEAKRVLLGNLFDDVLPEVEKLSEEKRHRVYDGEKINLIARVGKRRVLIKYRYEVSPHIYNP